MRHALLPTVTELVSYIAMRTAPAATLSALVYPSVVGTFPGEPVIHRKGSSNFQRQAWRSSVATGLGEGPDVDGVYGNPFKQRQDADGASEPNWRASSFDLAQGLEVTEMRSKVSQVELDKLFRS